MIEDMKKKMVHDYTLAETALLVALFAVLVSGAFGALVIVGLAIVRGAGFLIWLIPCVAAVVAALSVIIYVDPE